MSEVCTRRNRGIYGADEFGLYNNLTAGEASRKMIAGIGPGEHILKVLVSIKNQMREINKARESLSGDNVTLKSRGLPTFSITNDPR